MNNNIRTEEYYIASIDLLGMKEIIKNDKNDESLKLIRNIYKSWPKIIGELHKNIKIRFFSDNLVLAIKADINNAANELLEIIAKICFHFLKHGYKPRGGICKGGFYIDEIFVWGNGLVNAYLLECNEAKYPRIVISEAVLKDTKKHLKDCMILRDEDGKNILNYLRAFGRDPGQWVDDIKGIQNCLRVEIIEHENKQKSNEKGREHDSKISEKLLWLNKFLEDNKLFWESQLHI